jgi:hypothetical protein
MPFRHINQNQDSHMKKIIAASLAGLFAAAVFAQAAAPAAKPAASAASAAKPAASAAKK